jgi:endo-1,4-beta-xylanase
MIASSLIVAAIGVGVVISHAFAPVTTPAIVRPAGIPVGASYQGTGIIYNPWSGKCLNSDSNTANENGGKVQMWDCNGTRQQKWSFYRDAATRAYYMASGYGKCLDADLATIGRNGTKVQVRDCDGTLNQQWYPAISLTAASVKQFMFSASPAAGAFDALDEDNSGGNVYGAKVQLRSQAGGPDQAWSLSISGS